MNPRIVLASASPRRKELLERLGVAFVCIPSMINEVISDIAPEEQVKVLALRKACAVAYNEEDSVVIGADTTVVLKGTVYVKPSHSIHAEEMLHSLAGRSHQVYSGVSFVRVVNGEIKEHISDFNVTSVWLDQMSSIEIKQYVATGEPMDKAGGYGLQGIASIWVSKIEGCYTNVIGLSLPLIRKMFKQWNIQIF